MGSFSSSKRKKFGLVLWVYHTKYAIDGSIDRYKVCLVAKVFSQVEGIEYFETFAPLSKMNSIHLVLFLVAS